jgi:hypothetical protein
MAEPPLVLADLASPFFDLMLPVAHGRVFGRSRDLRFMLLDPSLQ